MSTVNSLKERLEQLKAERRAIVLAHYYQQEDIQDAADFVGDSFELSRKASLTDAEVIVFCGVHFMAESAAVLSPNKIVILPHQGAGCPMADMVDVDRLKAFQEQHSGAPIVSYVNTTAAVKAVSDICCTSANAVKVVNSLDADRVIFTPDRNLGRYVAAHTDKEIIVWEGFCPTHDHVTLNDLQSMRNRFPAALTVVHPECRPEVSAAADYVSSTAGILRFVRESSNKEFIIGTEAGILHALKQQNPEKVFHLLSPDFICPDMKLNTLETTVRSLETMQPRITVSKEVALKARAALDRMLAIH